MKFESKLEIADRQFARLIPEERKLLENPFRVTIKARFNSPYAYFSSSVAAIRENDKEQLENSPARDPSEIVGRTQGVELDEVEAIYIPDEIISTKLGELVKRKTQVMGINDRLQPFSRMDGVTMYY